MSASTSRGRCWDCGVSLRKKCFFIGYMNLIASVVDIGLHLLILGITTNGFQCDMDGTKMFVLDFPWLGPFFLLINLGTHGFYPFPLVLGSEHGFLDYNPTELRCYPGMLHVYLIDILNVMINIIWLKFVIGYVKALHRRDPEPMRMFFNIYLLKWIIQIVYVVFTPELHCEKSAGFWFLRSMDYCIAFIFLFFIRCHIHVLRETPVANPEGIDQPPSYFECLVTNAPQQKEKTPPETIEQKEPDVVVPIEETKTTELPKNEARTQI